MGIFAKLNLEVLSFLDPDLSPFKLDITPTGTFSTRFMREYRLDDFSFTGFFRFLVARSRGSVRELVFGSTFAGSLESLVYASTECPRVKVLTFPSLLPQEQACIPSFIGRWKDLEILDIGLKPSLFPRIIRQIHLNCKNLAGLQIFGSIGNKFALDIAYYLPKLKYLTIRRSFLRKEVLLSILAGCKYLEVLDARWCSGFDVDDDEILRRGSHIKEFNIEKEEDPVDDFEEPVDDYEDHSGMHWFYGDYRWMSN